MSDYELTRIGSTPQERGSLDNGTCPDTFTINPPLCQCAPDTITRIGSTPQQRGSLSNGTCPDVLALTPPLHITPPLERVGSTPQERGSLNNGTCPDIMIMNEPAANRCHETGLLDADLAMIGTDMTDELSPKLPPEFGAKLQPGDRIVVLDRRTVLDAMRDLP